jgi:branched-chain amino acid transport system permease protein
MKILCFALFACAFNLLLGFAGLLSFGHAAFLGARATCAACWCATWASRPTGHPRRHARAGALGWVFGVLAIRRTGHLLRDDHAGLAQMVFFIVLQ